MANSRFDQLDKYLNDLNKYAMDNRESPAAIKMLKDKIREFETAMQTEMGLRPEQRDELKNRASVLLNQFVVPVPFRPGSHGSNPEGQERQQKPLPKNPEEKNYQAVLKKLETLEHANEHLQNRHYQGNKLTGINIRRKTLENIKKEFEKNKFKNADYNSVVQTKIDQCEKAIKVIHEKQKDYNRPISDILLQHDKRLQEQKHFNSVDSSISPKSTGKAEGIKKSGKSEDNKLEDSRKNFGNRK